MCKRISYLKRIIFEIIEMINRYESIQVGFFCNSYEWWRMVRIKFKNNIGLDDSSSSSPKYLAKSPR